MDSRRLFDETILFELADQVWHGLCKPYWFRSLPEGEAGFYELVAGAGFCASKPANK